MLFLFACLPRVGSGEVGEVSEVSEVSEDTLPDSECPTGIELEWWYRDADGDGYGTDSRVAACEQPVGYAAQSGDCDDTDPAFHPNAPEKDCTSDLDFNCDGSAGTTDDDGDGYRACEECDDSDPAQHPGADEVCNGEDDDCNQQIDDDATDGVPYYIDEDGDGYGGNIPIGSACQPPVGYAGSGTDCDDSDAAVNPGAAEICNGVDDDCNATTSEAGTATVISGGVASSFEPDGYVETTEDATYHFCDGTWNLNLLVEHDTQIRGFGDVVLTSNLNFHVFLIDGAAVDLAIEGITIADNSVTDGWGAGIACVSGDTLIRNSTFEGHHTTDFGAAIAAAGSCTMELQDVLIQDNVADEGGGGLVVSEHAMVTVRDSDIKNNGGGWAGGAVLAYDAQVYFFDSKIHGNVADGYGGGVFIDDTSIDDGSVFESDGCDWGSGSDDNSPYDVHLGGSGEVVSEASSARMVCDQDGCYEYY